MKRRSALLVCLILFSSTALSKYPPINAKDKDTASAVIDGRIIVDMCLENTYSTAWTLQNLVVTFVDPKGQPTTIQFKDISNDLGTSYVWAEAVSDRGQNVRIRIDLADYSAQGSVQIKRIVIKKAGFLGGTIAQGDSSNMKPLETGNRSFIRGQPASEVIALLRRKESGIPAEDLRQIERRAGFSLRGGLRVFSSLARGQDSVEYTGTPGQVLAALAELRKLGLPPSHELFGRERDFLSRNGIAMDANPKTANSQGMWSTICWGLRKLGL